MVVKMKNTSVGVIIPTVNRRDKLKKCLEHLSQQSVLPGKVYVVYESHAHINMQDFTFFPNDRLIFLENNGRGPCDARNTALDICQEDIAAFLDDDSFAAQNWIEECIKGFDCFPYPAQQGRISWSRNDEKLPFRRRFLPRLRQKIYDSRDRQYRSPAFYNHLVQPMDLQTIKTLPGISIHLSGGNCALRMDYLEEIGFYDKRFITYHDKEIAYRILSRGSHILYNPDLIVYHDHHPSIIRCIKRSLFSIPYEKLLHSIYPPDAWENPQMYYHIRDVKVPVMFPLSALEKLFLWFLKILASVFRFFNFKINQNPIERQ
jgi:GT2 family glycosyltransferase